MQNGRARLVTCASIDLTSESGAIATYCRGECNKCVIFLDRVCRCRDSVIPIGVKSIRKNLRVSSAFNERLDALFCCFLLDFSIVLTVIPYGDESSAIDKRNKNKGKC